MFGLSLIINTKQLPMNEDKDAESSSSQTDDQQKETETGVYIYCFLSSLLLCLIFIHFSGYLSFWFLFGFSIINTMQVGVYLCLCVCSSFLPSVCGCFSEGFFSCFAW